jgi:hypothetical protein
MSIPKKVAKSVAAAITAKKVITIPASDLAWLCGMDHYNNLAKCLCNIWKQLDKTGFTNNRESVTKTQGYSVVDSTHKKIHAIQQRNIHTGTPAQIDVLQAVKAVNANKDKTSTDLVAAQQVITQQLAGMDAQSQALMTQLVKSATNVMHGVHKENSGLELFTKQTGLQVPGKQGKVAYVLYTDPVSGIEWTLSGRYDGLTTTNELVEIKNRQSRLFNKLRDYEECQIQAYLHALGLESGYLMEQRTTDTGAEFNIIPVKINREYMNRIVPWIIRTSNVINMMMQDPEMQSCVMRGDIPPLIRQAYEQL